MIVELQWRIDYSFTVWLQLQFAKIWENEQKWSKQFGTMPDQGI